jgi:predicted amidohydrolase YtcJ
LLKGRPIYLQRVDGHASWLSERALELTLEALGGTLPEKVDGGDIIKDADGQATGISSIQMLQLFF